MHTQPEKVMPAAGGEQAHRTSGIVLHSPILYDLTVWLAMLGKERGFREKLLQLAHIKDGERILDVGCGTGTLAIAAKRHVGRVVPFTESMLRPKCLQEGRRRQEGLM